MTDTTTDTKQSLAKLESIAKTAASLETSVIIRDGNGDEFKLFAMMNVWQVNGYPLEAGAKYPDYSAPRTQPNKERPFLKRNYRGPGSGKQWGTTGEELYTFSEILKCLATDLPGATLVLETVTVKTKDAKDESVKGPQLKHLAIEAWCEAAGLKAPTAQEMKDAKASNKNLAEAKRKEVVEQLRSGPEGIKLWNSSTQLSKASLKLQDLDLSGADLSNANLSNLDFSGTNFSATKLTGAKCNEMIAKNCNFKNAIIHDSDWLNTEARGATFENADFKRINSRTLFFQKAKFLNARFETVNFDYAQVQGADFTGATFKDCTFHNTDFDVNTIFPDDFEHWKDLRFTGSGIDPRKVKAFNESHSTESLNFETFLERLGNSIDKERLKKSLSMLKKEKFELFSELADDSVNGIVKSQTDAELVYSCRLTSEGQYSCCTQNLNACGGLRGAICKHILVLILGLAKAGQLDPNKADLWARTSVLHSPKMERDNASEILLKYKGAEAGEIDWRPTETTPEDFYAF